MKTFIYFNKLDNKKEPYGRVQADDEEEAIIQAALIKQMSIDDFLNIFEVEEIK
jgi:hypothetical protein